MDEKANASGAAAAEKDLPQPEAKLTAHELVKKHLEETSKRKYDELPADHLLLVEHVELAQLEDWQKRALLARFHAEGLREHSRLHPDVFKAALELTLKGRI